MCERQWMCRLLPMRELFIPSIPLSIISLATHCLEAVLQSVVCYRMPLNTAYPILMCHIKFIYIWCATAVYHLWQWNSSHLPESESRNLACWQTTEREIVLFATEYMSMGSVHSYEHVHCAQNQILLHSNLAKVGSSVHKALNKYLCIHDAL